MQNTSPTIEWTYVERHPGEVLRCRFLEPLGTSPSALARAIGVSRSRVSEILAGKRGMTPDTALRLGRFFGMDPMFWIALQGRWDLARATVVEVVPADTSGFLVGPEGVTPLPERAPAAPVDGRFSDALLQRVRSKAADTPDLEERRELEHVRYADGQHAWVNKVR